MLSIHLIAKIALSHILDEPSALLRLDEHIDKKDPKSVVSLHINDEHKLDWDNVSILDKGKRL